MVATACQGARWATGPEVPFDGRRSWVRVSDGLETPLLSGRYEGGTETATN